MITSLPPSPVWAPLSPPRPRLRPRGSGTPQHRHEARLLVLRHGPSSQGRYGEVLAAAASRRAHDGGRQVRTACPLLYRYSHTHTYCSLARLSPTHPFVVGPILPPFAFSHGIFRSDDASASLPPVSSSLTHTHRMDGFCNQNADQLGSLAGLSFPTVHVGVVECASALLSPASSSLTHTRRMDGFCNQNADQLGSLAGLSFPAVYVGVVECAPDSLSSASSSLTHTRRMDGFCNQNADQLGSLAGLSFPAVYVGVVECVSVFLPPASFSLTQAKWCVGRPARRSSESGHDGGWRLRLVVLANCEAADCSIGSASARAAVPGSLAGLPLSNGGWSVGRGAVQGVVAGVCPGGHARPWRRAAGVGVGARGPSERRAAGLVQGFQLPQGQGCSPGPRTWDARGGRAVTCARGCVAWRAACGCAAATYGDLRQGGYCASGA